MKKYYPSYYDKFSCIAGDCPDSCCSKWEIVIDNDTLKKYNGLTTDFGEKIRSFIEEDEEGDSCFRLCNGNCPFLNEDMLCDIHINLGEAYTSEICRNHPRFVEEYDGFTEISLSLSCPEANRIITSEHNPTYPVPSYNGDDEVLSLLISSRNKLLKEKTDFRSSIKLLLDTAADDSIDIDLVYIESHPVTDVSFIKAFAQFLSDKSEILTVEWKKYLETAIEANVSDADFNKFCKQNNTMLLSILKYFVYRYYLKAVNDLDVYSRALFIASACLLSSLAAYSNNIALSEASRLFSKETEHNLFNLDLLLGYFSEF